MATEAQSKPRRKTTFLEIVLIGCMVLVGTCLMGYGIILRAQRAEERDTMGYLARAGGVPDTYEAVERYLNEEFTPGMTREEVTKKLDERFIYRIYLDPYKSTHYSDWVHFPTSRCSKSEFLDAKCRSVSFGFRYDEGRLEEVKLLDSI